MGQDNNGGVAPAAIQFQKVFAFIWNETVMNVIVCDNYQLANDMAKGSYGPDAFAVDCGQWGCEMGDKYIDGVFYEEDGVTPIPYIPPDRDIAENALRLAQLAQDRIDELTQMLAANNVMPIVYEWGNPTAIYYNEIYWKNNMDINKIPDIGNLRAIIDASDDTSDPNTGL